MQEADRSRFKTNMFFTASPLKLVLLSVFTFGYYEFYWFYRNWLLFKAQSGKRIWPAWRAVFAPIWAYSMFSKIYAAAAGHGLPVIGTAKILTACYIVFFLFHLLPDPFKMLAVLTVAPLFLANQAASLVNEAAVEDYRENSRFTVLNMIALFFGILFVGLNILFKFYDGPSLQEFHENSGFSVGARMRKRLAD